MNTTELIESTDTHYRHMIHTAGSTYILGTAKLPNGKYETMLFKATRTGKITKPEKE